MRAAIALLLLTPLAVHAAALPPAGDEAACQAAIQGVEHTVRLPPALLSAIARTESGRVLPSGRLVAWPWTINVAGTGYYYATAEEAAAAVQTFRSSGIQSIDVGCMQVNLMHHPGAFASLQQAFDPAVNVLYAAQFLGRLQAEFGTWPAAVGAYHSRTPDLADEYGRRVMQAWPLAAAYGGMVGIRTAAVSQQQMIDPYGIYTPEFARRVAADAAAHNARERLHALAGAPQPAGVLAQRFPSQLRVPGQRAAATRFAQADSASPVLRRPRPLSSRPL
ncbi:MAG TPA: lytic transglycosylase domain-containing protein [Acetobacteraceae bacterium]